MKIAIAGFGIEGKSNFNYFSRLGHDMTIVDERGDLDGLPEGVKSILGEGAFQRLQDFDMVVRTAGLSPKKMKTDGKIWSASNEFFEKCPAQIVGVTGTKGKGTTASLIASILKAGGKTVHLIGNIGVPALDVLDNINESDIVVYELSSFQLWDLEKSPQVAVVLMIEPDHLNVHENFEDYVSAKSRIAVNQKNEDVIIFNRDNQWSRQVAEKSPAKTRIEYPEDLGELASHVRLPGQHNLENASAAVAAAKQFVDGSDAIARGLESFSGLDHRLKFVAKKQGVKYFDDSISTTAGSSIAAINSFDEPKVLILGGSSKGVSYASLVEACREQDVKVIAIGETGAEIVELCHQFGVVAEQVEGLMQEVVARANQVAKSGDVVILSPASASFDQYQCYSDRGDQFIDAVMKLAE